MSRFTIPQIAAHRGLAAGFPANTMISFEAAARYQPAYIELDFHSSADGQLVCVHDFKLDNYVKHTQPQWTGQSIAQMTLAQLEAIDMGSWKDARFKGTQMPTLEAVLRRFTVGSSPAAPKLLLERKTGSASQLLELLERVKPDPDSFVVMSFDWDFLKAVRELGSALPLALLGSGELRDEQITTAVKLNAVAMDWNHELTGDAIARLHAADLQAWVYTFNDPAQWLHAREIGMDVITTDCCDVLSKFVWPE